MAEVNGKKVSKNFLRKMEASKKGRWGQPSTAFILLFIKC
jgi:hypothetical protein